jgi:hypothetical protein
VWGREEPRHATCHIHLSPESRVSSAAAHCCCWLARSSEAAQQPPQFLSVTCRSSQQQPAEHSQQPGPPAGRDRPTALSPQHSAQHTQHSCAVPVYCAVLCVCWHRPVGRTTGRHRRQGPGPALRRFGVTMLDSAQPNSLHLPVASTCKATAPVPGVAAQPERQPSSSGSSSSRVQLDVSKPSVLRPGMVLLRGALPPPTQRLFASLAFRRGDAGECGNAEARGFQSWWATANLDGSSCEGRSAGAAGAATGGGGGADTDASASGDDSKRTLNVARKNAGRVYDSVESFPGGDVLSSVAW